MAETNPPPQGEGEKRLRHEKREARWAADVLSAFTVRLGGWGWRRASSVVWADAVPSVSYYSLISCHTIYSFLVTENPSRGFPIPTLQKARPGTQQVAHQPSSLSCPAARCAPGAASPTAPFQPVLRPVLLPPQESSQTHVSDSKAPLPLSGSCSRM